MKKFKKTIQMPPEIMAGLTKGSGPEYDAAYKAMMAIVGGIVDVEMDKQANEARNDANNVVDELFKHGFKR